MATHIRDDYKHELMLLLTRVKYDVDHSNYFMSSVHTKTGNKKNYVFTHKLISNTTKIIDKTKNNR